MGAFQNCKILTTARLRGAPKILSDRGRSAGNNGLFVSGFSKSRRLRDYSDYLSAIVPPRSMSAGGTVTVRELGAGEDTRWRSFVAESPEATFFHRLPWRDIIEETLGHRSHYRCAWRGDRLVGILPLTEIHSRLFGHSLVSPGFGVSAGIAAEDDDAAQALAADAARLGQSLGVDYVELRHEAARPIDWLTPAPRFFVFRRELAGSAEANMKAIPRKKRADLRKALANSALRIEHGQDFDSFFRLYAVSLRNLGTPILPRRFYAAIPRAFGADVEIAVVHDAKEPVAAVMSFYFKGAVLPYYGGAVPAARQLHAYDLLYWGVLCRGVERGARVFDFGRSRDGGSAFDYKTYWGFAPQPAYYQYHLGRAAAPPHLGPDNPKFRYFVKAWRRLPLGLATRLGPVIARQLG
jgi:FemAB-related protein (PEP-CTERM system-associated)